MPSSGAHPQFHMGLVRRHGDKERPGAQGGTSSNELMTTGAHVGTHVDALGHWAVNGKIHGGLDATDATKGGRFRRMLKHLAFKFLVDRQHTSTWTSASELI
jgi:hypothetical protein